MRILHWTENFLPALGGVEVLVMHLMHAQGQRGHEVALLTGAHRGDAAVEYRDGVPVHRLPFRRTLEAADLPAMRRLCAEAASVVRSFRPDVLHIHVSGPNAFYQLHSRVLDEVRVVATLHGAPEQAAGLRGATGMMLQKCSGISTVSEFVHAQVLKERPELAAKARLMVNALPQPAAPAVPRPGGVPRLLAFGRLEPEKGFDVAIEALALLPARHAAAALHIVGNGSAGDSLWELARARGVQQRVHMHGGVQPSGVHAHIDDADMVIVPSRWREAFGLVALEAAQRGRAVIASDRGGLSGIVLQGETGLLVPVDDAPALAAAITSLLDEPDVLDRMGRNALTRARTAFSFDALVTACEAMYVAG